MVDRYNNGRGMSRASANTNCRSRCSCGDGGECRKLLTQLQKIDFSLIDTVLYLDAYPECKKALEYYHKLKCERKMIAEALAEKCDRPVTSFENANTDRWVWVDGPWPWEPAAN